MNASLAFIEGCKPQGEVECALVMQMACTHSAAMTVLGTFAGREQERNSPLKAATAGRLLRAYATQVETLRRWKNGGSQVVRVEHVHVNEGGQALIGNVRKDGSGEQDSSPTLDSSSQSKREHDAKQVAHAPHPALRSPNAERELVPGAGDAERPMSDARRTVAGSPEGK